jgi:parallel beta-helix repeat protein
MFSAGFLHAQTTQEKQKIVSKTNVKFLKEFAKQKRAEAKANKEKAIKKAKEKGWVIKEEGRELMRVTDDGFPIYYVTYNADAAISTRANTLHNGGSLGLDIEGQGMTAHVWDEGLARTTHQEYDGIGGNNRFSIGDGTSVLNFHSAHVMGTIISSGYVPQAKGMAPQAYGVGYDWFNDQSEASTAAGSGMLLSNHSYGWDATTINDAWFGQYGNDAAAWDDIMYNAPYYLMISSAGNDGADDTSNGAPLDGESAYDKLSGDHTNKNGLVVANAQDAIIEGEELVSVTINSSSSEGPTDDYRIKPDITGNGTGLYSTYEDADDSYNSISGTSMASPNVCGSLLLLQQYYKSIYPDYMLAATLKGLALHTADDAGPAGPDAVYGWGLLNTKQAARTITNNGDGSIISELTLNDGGSYSIDVTSDNINDLVVSISWTDPAGTPNSGTNSNTPALVNDLDVRVTQSTNTYEPYKLTGVTTNGTGDNIVDPYEKIIIPAASGTYTINVTHKGTLSSPQDYSLIVTGLQSTPKAPVANFNANSLNPLASTEIVNFYDLSENLPTSWSWSFSPATVSFVNGTYATSQNPQVRFNATGLYEVTLIASNAQGNDTEVKTDYINVTGTCTPCTVSASTDDLTGITNVEFNTIANHSNDGTPAYSDYTGQSTTVTAGNSYDINVSVNTGGAFRVDAKAWVDWNQDCVFDDATEGYNLGFTADVTDGATNGCPYSILVPTTALSGATTMRVRANYTTDGSPAPLPCGDISWSETEDYTINVINTCADPSNLTAAGLTTTTADLFWTNNSSATNWDIEWGTTGFSPTGTPDEDDVTSNPFTLTGLTAGTSYDFYVRADCGADNSDVSDWVGPYNFTTLSGPPSISGVDIDAFFKDKGDVIVVSGSNLLNATSVEIGGTSGTIGANTATSVAVTFPAGVYANNTLTLSTASGSDTYTMNLQTRNTIPVGGGTDYHTTIQSALDGLYAWMGTTPFDADKVIDVYSGTYAESVIPNNGLATTATNGLVIQNHSGESPVVDANGQTYGFNIDVRYTTLSGFTVHSASSDNVYIQNEDNVIEYVQSYNAGESGINASFNTVLRNNLCYSNANYGIHVLISDGATLKNNTTYDNGHSIVGPQTSTYSFSGSVPIIDRTSVYADIPVSENVTITNVRVLNMNITHTWDSDLDIYLQHPDGTEVELTTDNGGNGDNYINTNFDDDAATSITSGSAPFTGTFSPEGTLSDFDSESSSGTWRLRVYDDQNGDEGTITAWTLEVTYSANEIFGAGLYVESGTGTSVENNIFVAKSGTDYVAMKTESGITIASDYNTYFKNGNTNIVSYSGTPYADFAAWPNEGTADLESDPDFTDALGHINSLIGYYQGTEWPPSIAAGTWTTGANSPALDAGNPTDDFSSEPDGGTAVNQGAYGNTAQASKTSSTPNTAPDITSDGGLATASVSADENQTSVTTVTATDPESDNITYSISGGTDQVLFGINATTGELSFLAAPDFENPGDADANNDYVVEVTATDDGAGSLTDAQTITVTVVNVNESPDITSHGGLATASVSADENQTSVTTVTATDPESDNITYSISGGTDQALFGINATTGELSFLAAPDFENPGDADANNDYVVEVTATDDGAGTLTDAQTITVTVQDLSETGSYTVSGTLKYDNAAQSVLSGETIVLEDAGTGTSIATTTTDGSGYYEFTGIADGTYTVKGGATLTWSGASSMDVTIYKKHIIGSTVLTGMKLISGDVNNSGSITSTELPLFLQRIVWMISSFPDVSDWAYSNGDVTVAGANETVNLQAICYGDANGSYAGAKSFKSIHIENSGTVYANPDGTFELPVKVLSDLKDLASVTLEIPYNTEIVDITEVEMMKNNQDMNYHISDGKLRIAYSSLNASDFGMNENFLIITGTVKNLTDISMITDYAEGEFGNYTDNVISAVGLSIPALGPVALSTEFLEEKILIYPNPANTFINITNAKDSRIEIYNIAGSKVISCDIEAYDDIVNIGELSAGSYYIKIYKNNMIYTQKLSIIK